jgi:2-dehydro-3-deoxygalactonokinase
MRIPNQPFIAVDWGTSSFRAALITPNGDVLDELSTARGILGFKPDEFVPYLVATCERLSAAGGKTFLLSGMIGSKNGLKCLTAHVPQQSQTLQARLAGLIQAIVISTSPSFPV